METIKRKRGRPRKDATKPANEPVAKALKPHKDNIDNIEGKSSDKSGTLGSSAAAMLRYAMAVSDRRPPICADEYITRRDEYFNACVDADALPSKPGLSIALGYNGVDHMTTLIGQQEDSSALVHWHKKTIGIMEDATSALTTQGKIGAMFLLKASYGYRETTSIAAESLPSLNISLNFGAIPSANVSGTGISAPLVIELPNISST